MINLTNFEIKKIIFLVFLTIMADFIAGCDNCSAQSAKTWSKSTPVIVGIIFDKSISARHQEIIDSSSLSRLVQTVGHRGGALAIGTITDNSFAPLLVGEFKLHLLPVEGNLRQKAQANAENRRRKTEFNIRIKKFVANAMRRLSGPRDAEKSDIAGIFERFYILLNQPQYQNLRKILILHTDGKDTNTKSFNYIPEAEFFTVGWRANDAEKLLNSKVIQFESFAGCLDYLIEKLK